MKFLSIITLLFLAVPHYSQAATCSKLEKCVLLVSKLTNKKYLYPKELKGEVKLSENFKITAENADDFLSEALAYNGFTRVPTNKDQWTVLNARDVRYVATPNYTYGKDEIPNNYDHVMVNIKLKNSHLTSEIARNFRPFMSRYGRIIDIKATGTIIISDTSKNVHRLIELIKVLDIKPRKEDLSRIEKAKDMRNKLKLIKASKCSDIAGDLREIKAMLYKR